LHRARVYPPVLSARTLRAALWRRLQARGAGGGRVVTLGQRHIYILPTRDGLVFGLMLLAMLLGAANYNNSLGFVLTFLLGSMALVSILHTYRNLAGLQLQPGHCPPVFAGEQARFQLWLDSAAPHPRADLLFGWTTKDNQVALDVPAPAPVSVVLERPAARRGVLPGGRVVLRSRFPLGLFYAWSWIDLELSCLVYPRPLAGPVALGAASAQAGPGSALDRPGQEDFLGLRPYRPGDSPRHVAWKQAAQRQDLLTKQFAEASAAVVWLDLDAVAGPDLETRLSYLCAAVLDLDRTGRTYGLRLLGATLGPDSGNRHRQRCLEQLARFEER
jgi:uncharacterized protein (DUF58 family)